MHCMEMFGCMYLPPNIRELSLSNREDTAAEAVCCTLTLQSRLTKRSLHHYGNIIVVNVQKAGTDNLCLAKWRSTRLWVDTSNSKLVHCSDNLILLLDMISHD